MPKRETSFHVGIDLGTTNTVMATCKPRNKFLLPVVRDINQYLSEKQIGVMKRLPSVLYWENNGEVIVGEYARQKKEAGYSDRVLYNTKMDIGSKIIYNNGYTPVKAATEILKVCFNSIKTYISDDEEFPNVTITVPGCFSLNKVADTLEAAKQAGFAQNKVSLLEEPVATLFCYVNEQLMSRDVNVVDFSSKKRVMIYHIGAGICDVCIVDFEFDDNKTYDIKYIVANRYTEFGSDDFDEAVAIGLFNKLIKKHNITESNNNFAETKYDLISRMLPFCEQYRLWYTQQLMVGKREHIENAHYGILDDFFGISQIQLEVPFSDYLEYTKIFFKDNYTHPTRDLTDKMRDKNVIRPVYQLFQKLKDAGERSIDCILLTGGMSEYLPIEEALRDFCDVPVIKTKCPKEAAALGAAMSAFIKTSNADKCNAFNL